jgi:hypothetical protein
MAFFGIFSCKFGLYWVKSSIIVLSFSVFLLSKLIRTQPCNFQGWTMRHFSYDHNFKVLEGAFAIKLKRLIEAGDVAQW